MAIQGLEEDDRLFVAAAIIDDEAELMDIRSSFSPHSGELNYLKIGDQIEVRNLFRIV